MALETDGIARAAVSVEEAKALVALRREEDKKGPSSKKKHPPFSRLWDLQYELLNAEQVRVLLVFYGVPCPAELNAETAKRLLVTSDKVPINRAREAERALKKAALLVKRRVGSFASHYGHLTRAANQIYGSGSRPEWRTWSGDWARTCSPLSRLNI